MNSTLLSPPPSPSSGRRLPDAGAALRRFLRLEAAGGILLIVATVAAMILANTPARGLYDALLEIPLQFRAGALNLEKPLLLWINDGLMAVFFFLIGLELKRELLEGELSRPERLVLPGLGAIGGMAVPAGIYAAMNWGDPVAMQGWAIPAATDIAFALGILSLLGSRVPISLKVFLVSLAIMDDIGAILIIAIFYTAQVSLASLVVAAAALVVLFVLNRRGVSSLPAYLLTGFVLWVAVLKSGVHATLAGVTLAFFIPLRPSLPGGPSMLKSLEHRLHGTVAFVILPVFALANAGVPLQGFSPESILSPVPLGIILGLVAGKFIGVFLMASLGVAFGWTGLPPGMNWRALAGVSLLCGVGFTMSLFIGSLAFEGGGLAYDGSERLGILIGSSLAGTMGFLILAWALPSRASAAGEDEPPEANT
ncbi:MAG: Na+/H+ antiporter NhaA [Akkermansiaceae bacterium]|nr:Na+/H+ antiporter NhaA [Akkermansiaceae bacterium]NNM29227.1 Na+/H+ antiporter NhaA [Akkermansiaceae bacterium]